MDKNLKRYKVGIDSETLAISLVDEPAIEEDFVYLKKEKPQQIFMQSDEKHMVYGAVLVPDKDIYRIDPNGNEFLLSFTKESIEKMAYDFLKEYRQNSITLMHEDYATEITLVESWIKTDMEMDKSIALGLNKDLPVGTWFSGMKVNNIDTWEQIKSGELKGFSVESLISLENFNKIEEDMKADDNFWNTMKNVLKEILFGANKQEEETEIEPIQIEEMEAETPVETVTEIPVEQLEAPVVEEPVVEAPVAEEKVEEPVVETPVVEEKKNEIDSDVLTNLLEEIKSLKEKNNELISKVNDLSSQPSTKPLSVNAKPTAASTYSNWREQLKNYLG